MFRSFFLYRRRRWRHGYGLRLFAVSVSAAVLLFLLVAMTQLRPILNSMATARVSNAVHKAVVEAVTETLASGVYDYSDLISLEKDNDGKITALTSNMVCFNRLQIEVTENVMERVGNISSSELEIPLGSLTGIALLSGRGPELQVRILSVGSPSAEFENRFTDAGINQTKHQVLLHVRVMVRILMPGYTTATTVDCSLAVAETVIVGSVPETYTYFYSDSTDAVQEYVTNQ